jgi:U3 small nucleolar ribonucleoprotein component
MNYQLGKQTKTITEQELSKEIGEISQQEIYMIERDNRRKEIQDQINAIDRNLIMKKEWYIERSRLSGELDKL